MCAGRKICSSLLLQQLLYYNVFWSVGWLIAFVTRICMRVSGAAVGAVGASGMSHNMLQLLGSAYLLMHPPDANDRSLHLAHAQYGEGLLVKDPDVVRTVLIVFWLVAEPLRLAAGWFGNLQENVSVLGLRRGGRASPCRGCLS